MRNQSNYTSSISTHTPTKGATLPLGAMHREIIISTHTPTKGATQMPVRVIIYNKISTHTPTKGATINRKYKRITIKFQPTLPRRERPDDNQYGRKDF